MTRRLFWLLLWTMSWLDAMACPIPEVVVVIAHPAAPYRKTAEAVVQSLAQHRIPARIQTTERLVPPSCPKLWVAVGSRAVATIRKLDANTPLVATLVVDESVIHKAQPATGVTLMPPLEYQWRWFRRLLPQVKTLGVLYNPQRGDALQILTELGHRDGITVMGLAVETPKQLVEVLADLPDSIEALWLLGNGRLFSATTARSILMATFRRRIPLVGLSRQWVEAGALYAFDWDYEALGRQAAEQVLQIWRQPGDLPPPTHPNQLHLAVNRQVFRHLGLTLPYPLPEGTRLLP